MVDSCKRRWFGVTGIAAFVSVLGVGVVLSGCSLFNARERAGIVGDSITEQVDDAMQATSGDDWRLDIRRVPGATVGEMLPAVAGVAEARPDQVIINLGTNNVLRPVPLEQSVAELEAMFDLLAGVPCVHVLTVHDFILAWDQGDLTYRSQPFNEALVEIATRRGARVIDWTEVLTEASAPLDAPEFLMDTVHLTPEGVTLLTGTYDAALAAGCS
jgi:lysophospholipase L1-like esterase